MASLYMRLKCLTTIPAFNWKNSTPCIPEIISAINIILTSSDRVISLTNHAKLHYGTLHRFWLGGGVNCYNSVTFLLYIFANLLEFTYSPNGPMQKGYDGSKHDFGVRTFLWGPVDTRDQIFQAWR